MVNGLVICRTGHVGVGMVGLASKSRLGWSWKEIIKLHCHNSTPVLHAGTFAGGWGGDEVEIKTMHVPNLAGSSINS